MHRWWTFDFLTYRLDERGEATGIMAHFVQQQRISAQRRLMAHNQPEKRLTWHSLGKHDNVQVDFAFQMVRITSPRFSVAREDQLHFSQAKVVS